MDSKLHMKSKDPRMTMKTLKKKKKEAETQYFCPPASHGDGIRVTVVSFRFENYLQGRYLQEYVVFLTS